MKSRMKVRGKWSDIEQKPRKQHKNDESIDQKEENALIKAILDNQDVTHTQGEDRKNNILDELVGLNLINKDQRQRLAHEDLKLETVKDIEKMISEQENK